MKKKIILLTTIMFMLFGNSVVCAEEGKVGIGEGGADIDQEFIITNTDNTSSDNYTVTISWNINPMEFNIANDSYTSEGNTYYVYQPNSSSSKTSNANFTIRNESKRLIKVTGSFVANDSLDKTYIHNDFSELSYYLTTIMNTDPGVDENITFYVWGSLLNNSDKNRFIEKTVDSVLTVNESAFESYNGPTTGSIGHYHFEVSKA